MTSTDQRIQQIAERISTEITALIADGTLPRDIHAFADLHDHLDANELGGLTAENADVDIAGVARIQGLVHGWLGRRGNPMQYLFAKALTDEYRRPVLSVDLGAHAVDVSRYLRMLDIPPITQVIVYDVLGTRAWFIGDPDALERIRRDRARVVETTVGPTGAIVDKIVSNCWCPSEMLEARQHMSTCKDQF